MAPKALRPESAAVIGAERFLREITTTASLHHPHILPLHDSRHVRRRAKSRAPGEETASLVYYVVLVGEAPFTGPTPQAIVAKMLTTGRHRSRRNGGGCRRTSRRRS